RVMVDGLLLPGLTPITVAYPLMYPSGYHQVKIVYSGVTNVSEVEVRPGMVVLVRAGLVGTPPSLPEPAPDVSRWNPRSYLRGMLAASTAEAGLEVLVDGADTGRVTPLPISRPLELAPGPHLITFMRKDGSLVSRRLVRITAGEVTTLRYIPAD
ncbi:MAG TPA: hypothetical protein VFB81_18900, partial [Myxococcales bacterium]|nr:hypothetical protein [Myxococcales bacterium]